MNVTVAISGGTDSLFALLSLKEQGCGVTALHARFLQGPAGNAPVPAMEELCRSLGIPLHVVDLSEEFRRRVMTPFAAAHAEARTPNPCALCAKMRRGALNQALLEQGYSKVALGHHYDDAVETFLMSLLFEGRIGCFEPVTYLDRTGVTQIRPMLYLTEGMVRTFAAEHDLPVVHNPCPADKHTKRQEIKELVAVLSKTYPDLKTRVFGAMQRLPLPQWGVTPHQRGSQKQLHQHDGCKAGQAEKADDAGRGRGDGNIEPGQGRE